MALSSLATTSLTLLVLLATVTTRVGSQTSVRTPNFRAEIAVGYSSPLVKDANGTEVRATWSPSIGAGIAWNVAPKTHLSLTLRGARPSLDLEHDGNSWSGGSATIVDVIAAAEREIWQRVALRAGLGLVWLTGPDDVAPFRGTSGSQRFHAAFDAGAVVRPAWKALATRPIFLTFGIQGFRLGNATASDPVTKPGGILRFMAGVRYGR
ncbi:MAG: hypothetical protein ABR543_15865 [Gemmatimonadaceae bacterium]